MNRFDYAFHCPLANWAKVQRLQGGPCLPNFAMLYPIPQKPVSDYSSEYDDDSGNSDDSGRSDDGNFEAGFWLSPRMACKLFWHGVVLCGMWQEDAELWLEEALPPVALPYLKRRRWVEALLQCLKRLVSRIVKGLGPSPNCTGEEMALHLLIKYANDMNDDNDYTETLSENLRLLPPHRLDSSFDFVANHSMVHNHVLLLYDPMMEDMCLSEQGVGREQYLHPKDWFLAFRQDQAMNHAV